jgi:peptidoglycan/LPS O-acetylase OafA/YrhL
LLLACVFVLSPVVGWGEKPSASDWLPYALYVQNLVHPLVAPVSLGQMWSLAIEEQFYLVWPFVVLLVPRAALMKFALGTVAGSLAIRLAVAAAGAPDWVGYFATPCRVDALAFGAVLSILVLRGETGLTVIRKWAWPGAIAGTAGALPIAIALGSETVSGAVPGNHGIARSLLFSFVALAGFGLVGLALGRVNARLSALLRAGWLRYLGKISYGLYIYHATVFQAVHLQVVAHATHPDAPATKLMRSAIAMTLSVMLASVSWYALERPILRLKATWAAEAPKPRPTSV